MLGNVKVEIKKGGDFEPVPMDRYTCQISDVNLVSQFNQFQGKEEDVLNYQFQILDEKAMPTKDGEEAATTRGRYLWKRCRPAFNNRSWLGKLAKAALGRDLTNAEIDAFDPEAIVGKQVDVMVEQAESKDGQKIFNNIVAFNKTAKPLEPIAESAKEPGQVVEKTTQPVTVAPGAEDAEKFVSGLKAETPATPASEPAPAGAEDEDEDPEVLEAKLKLAQAKAKKAKEAAK